MQEIFSLPKLLVRTKEKMESFEREMLERAKLSDLGPCEAWTAEGTNHQLSYATHGFMRFFGKFPPPIASYLIEKYTNEGETVLDPMGGSGTSAVECLLRNRKCEIRDVNPMMLLLQKVKSTKLSSTKVLDALEKITEAYKPLNKDEIDYYPIGLRDPLHYFLIETVDSLNGIKKLIEDVEDKDIQDFLYVCFLSIIRRVSRATTQQGRLFLDIDTAEKNALPFFIKKVKKLVPKVDALNKSKYKINIQEHNLMDSLGNKYKDKMDLVILHPPYFNSYKYSGVNSLELSWLGVKHADIRKKEIREFFKVGKPEKYIDFVTDMAKALENAYDTLKPGAYMGFMMGDTAIKGKYIPVMRETLDKAILPNSSIETVALRVPKYTEASWAASQRRNTNNVGITLFDFVIVIKKNHA